MDNWLNLNMHPCWDLIHDLFASKTNPWTAQLQYLLKSTEIAMWGGDVHWVSPLRGYYTPNQKLACFVLYLKIINTFLQNSTCIS